MKNVRLYTTDPQFPIFYHTQIIACQSKAIRGSHTKPFVIFTSALENLGNHDGTSGIFTDDQFKYRKQMLLAPKANVYMVQILWEVILALLLQEMPHML